MIKQLSFLLLLMNGFGATLWAQEKINEHLYPFNNKVLNLKTLQYDNSAELPAHSFKTDSKYAVRYRGLAADQIAYKGSIFETLSDNGLLLKDMETKAATPLPNKEKGLAKQGQHFLLETNGGVIHIKSLQKDKGYMAYKYDEKGTELFAVQIPHSEFVQHGEFTYHLPYLGYTMHTANTIVFSSYVSRIPKTVTLSALDGSISNFDFSSIGVIRDGNVDMDIHGFVQIDKGAKKLFVTYISDNFSVERPYLAKVSHAETVILDNTLVVAMYDSRGPNAHLLAFDLTSKEVLWEADVTEFGGTPSTSYFNVVWLGAYDGKILLEGYESKGKYLQIFDTKTGKQLWKSF